MKNVTLSSKQLIEFGGTISIHKEDSIISVDDIYTFELARWNENLTAFPKSVPVVLSPNSTQVNEVYTEYKPTGVFAGRAVKFRRVSEKFLAFSLAVYDKGSDNNTMWIDCGCTGKTSEILEQYANGNNVVVAGDFSIEEHETFGTKLKLYVRSFTLMGGGKKGDSGAAKPAAQAKNTEEIPF